MSGEHVLGGEINSEIFLDLLSDNWSIRLVLDIYRDELIVRDLYRQPSGR